MGVVQSRKKEAKANKSSNSFMQYNPSTTSSQHQTNSCSSHKKQQLVECDTISKKTSIYSTTSSKSSTPTPVVSTSSKNVISAYRNSNKPKTESAQYQETTLLNAHQSNSFFLPKDWDLKEYQYNVNMSKKKNGTDVNF